VDIDLYSLGLLEVALWFVLVASKEMELQNVRDELERERKRKATIYSSGYEYTSSASRGLDPPVGSDQIVKIWGRCQIL
jgi:hypothetical protein